MIHRWKQFFAQKGKGIIGILSHWSLYWITKRKLRKSTPKPCYHVKKSKFRHNPTTRVHRNWEMDKQGGKGMRHKIINQQRWRGPLLDHHQDLHLKNIKSETNIKNQSEWSMKKSEVNLTSLWHSLWLMSAAKRVNQSLCRDTVKLVWKDASAVVTGWWTPMYARAWSRTGGWQVIMWIKKESSAWAEVRS